MDIEALAEAESEPGLLMTFQPVFDRHLDVKAFTLLADSNKQPPTRLAEDIQGIHQLIVESYTSIYQRGELQTLPAFLRVTEEALLDPSFPDLPHQHFIIELQVHSPTFSTRLCKRLQSLAIRGYQLAISGLPEDITPFEAPLKHVHIVRLATDKLERPALLQQVAALQALGLELLADGLKDRDQFRASLTDGFTLFAGSFHGEPTQVKGRKPGSNKVLLLELLAALDNPDSNLEDIEAIIIRDPSLTYRFLKLANAASYRLSREIETLSHALSMLGILEIQRWVTIFLLEEHTDKPRELIRRMLIRARLCEVLAAHLNRPRPLSYFIVGLLSQLDQLTDIAMEDLIAPVSLSQEIKTALLHRLGDMGMLLREVETYERGDFKSLSLLEHRNFYETSYRHSSSWANQLLSSQSDERPRNQNS